MANDTPARTFVIVGASLAGATAATSLREEGFDGRIVLVGEEDERPYERPPLSKSYLQGESEREKIYVHPMDWYAAHDVDLRLGTRVTRIDPATHQNIRPYFFMRCKKKDAMKHPTDFADIIATGDTPLPKAYAACKDIGSF